jgi:hypothetical protein
MKKKGRRSVTISVDENLFSKDVVLAACYALLGSAHVMVGRDEQTKDLVVKLIPIGGEDAKKLSLIFHDQLVNYAAYYKRVGDNSELKKLLIGTSLYSVEENDE